VLEDVVDLLAPLAEVETAVVTTEADRPLAEAVIWPGMRVYVVDVATPLSALRHLAQEGYAQAAILAADAPDLPSMLVGKLLRPLGRRQAAAAPDIGAERGLLGLAAVLPPPEWLIQADPTLEEATVPELRRAARKPGVVAEAMGWYRLRGPEAFRRLDPALEGWEATRALLSGV